jgi:hypothetical protein
MAEFREFRYDDLFFMNLRDFERQLFDGMQDCVLQILARAKEGAETCIYKGNILFIYTIQEYNGMATLSLIASEEADNHPIPFAMASKDKIEELAEKYRRLQATVHIDYEKSVRWLTAMGFEIEGTLRKYDHNGDDYYMMARTT